MHTYKPDIKLELEWDGSTQNFSILDDIAYFQNSSENFDVNSSLTLTIEKVDYHPLFGGLNNETFHFENLAEAQTWLNDMIEYKNNIFNISEITND